MATPTPGRPGPSHAVATPPVTTPFSASNHHLAFSPKGPRSVVPSPQQFKKSPANSNTLYGYPGGGGHPTTSSFGAGYDSPTAAMALGGVPDLAQLGLDGIGAPNLSGLGSLGRGDEDEQKRRLQHVLNILQVNKGKLSEAGIDRLAQRTGLATQWMTVSRTQKSLDIAASLMVLQITFAVVPNTKRFEVEEVALALSSSDIVERHAAKAGDILLRDLQIGPNESPLTKSLDRFAANLERLAALDKLSVTPGLNCYEAIAGIYESIEKLHKWEVGRLKDQEDMRNRDEEYLIRTALCKKSGRPAMHARGRLGLSLDFWQERHRLPSKDAKEDPRTWALLVECASPSSLVYTPARVSEKWISDAIQKVDPPAEDLFVGLEDHMPLDWLEPENTLIPSSGPNKPDAMDIDQSTDEKHPEVVFSAKFDPPLVVPYAVAMQICTQINTPIDMYEQSTFDGLAFPPSPGEHYELGEARSIKTQLDVTSYSGAGEKITHKHHNTLFIEKIDYGRTLSELPFAHPRQLVEMLPTLRQYAFLHSLLNKTFGTTIRTAPLPTKKDTTKSTKDKFAEFMAQSTYSHTNALALDVTLTTTSVPRLHVIFPFQKRTANISVDIKLNATVEVVSQNVLTAGSGSKGGKELTAADLGRMLEVCEDLGTWAEFIRRRLG